MIQRVRKELLEELSSYIQAKYSTFAKSPKRIERLKRIKEARKAYNQEVKPQNWPWRNASNLIVPLTLISVDQLEPRLVASLIGRDEIITIDDTGKLDRELCKKIEKFDNAVLKNDVRITTNVRDWVRTILIDGQVYLQPYWAYRDVKTRQYLLDAYGQPVPAEPGDPDALMGLKTREVVTTIVDGVRIDQVPVETLFFPDRIDDWEEVPVIRKIWIPVKDLRAHVLNKDPGWAELSEEELDELSGRAYTKRPQDPYEYELNEPDEDEKVVSGSSEAQRLKAEICALEAHVSYDIDGDGDEENLICVIEASSGKVLRLVNNNTIDPLNRKQIQPWWMVQEEFTGYGVPLHNKVREIERGATVLFNMLINSAMVQMIPWFFYEVGAGFSGQTIELIPGKGQPVNDISKLFFPTINPSAAAFKDFITIFFGLWERITSVSDYNVGRQSEIARTRATATGTLALIQESQILHEYMGTCLQQNFIKILEIVHDLYYLNATDDTYMQVLGEKIPKVLSKNYIFKLVSSTKSANRHVERQELAEALQVAEKGIQLGLVNPQAVIKTWLETFKDIDVEEWMNTLPNAVVQRLTAPQTPGGIYDPFPQIVQALVQMDPPTLLKSLAGLREQANVNMPESVNEERT